LGGKYPFFFRNGKTAYKEFPISGLISYLGDEEGLFLKDEDMGLENALNNHVRTNTLDSKITSKDTWYFDNMLNQFGTLEADKIKPLYGARDDKNSIEN
jgi:hypothetical protein